MIWRRVKRFFSPGIKFHSRRSKIKWYLGVFGKIFSLITIIAFLGMLFGFNALFELPGQSGLDGNSSGRIVNISSESVDLVIREYDPSLEKRFCVYGYANSDYIVVEDLVKDDNPSIQKKDRIKGSCIDETLDMLPKMLMDNESQLLGYIHTHPYEDGLSNQDAFTFGGESIFYEVSGVYDGSEIEFYSERSLYDGLNMSVRGR